MSDIWWMILRRLALGVLTLFVVTLLIFGAIQLLPGDPAQAILGQAATPETLAALRTELGLDLPAWQRYLNWISGVLHGDFGVSLANKRPISELIAGRLANTLFLALYAAVIAVVHAIQPDTSTDEVELRHRDEAVAPDRLHR